MITAKYILNNIICEPEPGHFVANPEECLSKVEHKKYLYKNFLSAWREHVEYNLRPEVITFSLDKTYKIDSFSYQLKDATGFDGYLLMKAIDEVLGVNECATIGGLSHLLGCIKASEAVIDNFDWIHLPA